MHIDKTKLIKVLETITDNLKAHNFSIIEIDEDYYWKIKATESYRMDMQPELVTGSLIDDWQSLEKLIVNNNAIVTAVDYERLAAILTFISEKIAK